MSEPPALETLTGDRSTLTTRALEALRAAIVDGRLEAGERYSVAQLAERRQLVVFSDEIYDQMTYDAAQFVNMTLGDSSPMGGTQLEALAGVVRVSLQ